MGIWEGGSAYYYYPNYARFLIHPSALPCLAIRPFGQSAPSTALFARPYHPWSRRSISLAPISCPFTHSNFATLELGVHALSLCVLKSLHFLSLG